MSAFFQPSVRFSRMNLKLTMTKPGRFPSLCPPCPSWLTPSLCELCDLCESNRISGNLTTEHTKDTKRSDSSGPNYSPAKAQRRQGYGGRIKTLIDDFHPQSPNFAPFVSLRDILRDSVAALPRWDLRGEKLRPLRPLCLSGEYESGCRTAETRSTRRQDVD